MDRENFCLNPINALINYDCFVGRGKRHKREENENDDEKEGMNQRMFSLRFFFYPLYILSVPDVKERLNTN